MRGFWHTVPKSVSKLQFVSTRTAMLNLALSGVDGAIGYAGIKSSNPYVAAFSLGWEGGRVISNMPAYARWRDNTLVPVIAPYINSK